MFTLYDFYQGMFCELGGEFVDTNHEDIINLANELGVGVQRLDEGGGEDLYFFGGKWHMPKDMIDPEKQSGAFAPIAEKIAEDAAKLYDEEENWTDYARELDKVSLKAYLDQFRGKAPDWAIDLLDIAYTINEGLDAEDQSCLMMVDAIATDMSEPFQIFGESDEAWRIKGGSSALINGLVAALENKIELKLRYALADPRPAIHQAEASHRFGELGPWRGQADMHSRAWHGAKRKNHGWHHVAGVAHTGI
jgi:monoamine oxidase